MPNIHQRSDTNVDRSIIPSLYSKLICLKMLTNIPKNLILMIYVL